MVWLNDVGAGLILPSIVASAHNYYEDVSEFSDGLQSVIFAIQFLLVPLGCCCFTGSRRRTGAVRRRSLDCCRSFRIGSWTPRPTSRRSSAPSSSAGKLGVGGPAFPRRPTARFFFMAAFFDLLCLLIW